MTAQNINLIYKDTKANLIALTNPIDGFIAFAVDTGEIGKYFSGSWVWNTLDGSGYVTNGDSHDHSGGDGAQIDHVNVANKGTNTHATIDNYLSGLSDYIDGLQMVRVSGTALTVKVGSAYIPSLGYILNVSSDVAKSSLSLSNSTWYHVYLYLNAGSPDIEIVTTAPAIYHGTSRQKTGDNSRRYIGSFKTDGSGNIYNFNHLPNNLIVYKTNTNEVPFRVLANGTSTTVETDLDCSGIIPVTAFIGKFWFSNPSTNAYLETGTSDDGYSHAGGVSIDGILNIDSSKNVSADHPLDTSQHIQYWFNVTPSPLGAYIFVIGYYYER